MVVAWVVVGWLGEVDLWTRELLQLCLNPRPGQGFTTRLLHQRHQATRHMQLTFREVHMLRPITSVDAMEMVYLDPRWPWSSARFGDEHLDTWTLR